MIYAHPACCSTLGLDPDLTVPPCSAVCELCDERGRLVLVREVSRFGPELDQLRQALAGPPNGGVNVRDLMVYLGLSFETSCEVLGEMSRRPVRWTETAVLLGKTGAFPVGP